MAFPNTDLDIIVEAYLGADPTADPGDWPAATDLSSRLLRQDVQIQRGRRSGQKTLSSGSCQFWLDNTDGALTPLLATSPYYPDWDLGVPVRLSVDNVGTSPPYVRFAGFLADCRAVMVPGTGGQNISAVRVTLGGVWRRISQGAVVKSALARGIASASLLYASPPLRYWPCEDASGASRAGEILSRGDALVTGDYSFAGSAAPPAGSSSVLRLGSGASITGRAPTGNGEEWSVEFLFNLTTPPAGATTIFHWSTSGSLPNWQVVLTPGSPDTFSLEAYDSGGTRIINSVSDFTRQGTELYGTFVMFTVGATQSGANIAWGIKMAQAGGSSTTATGSTVGTVGSVDGVGSIADANSADMDIGHISIWQADLVALGAFNSLWLDGFIGELAHVRFERLCAEEGIVYSGTATDSQPMGPQPVGDIAVILQDCETVDHGMIIEDFNWGLNYRAYSQRINQSPAMTIDLSSYRTTRGTSGDVLAPVRNDQRLRNEWTISRPDGSSDTFKDETHQAKRGRYNDEATVNVETDDDLLNEASWRVHEGTFDGLRYDTIPIDLAANE